MVVAVGKGIDRAHGKSEVKPMVRKPLSWEMLEQGRGLVAAMGTEGTVTWPGLALSYFLLCRASELWAYRNGFVHSGFCLTRGDLCFLNQYGKLKWEDGAAVDRVEVNFPAPTADSKRLEEVVTRAKTIPGHRSSTLETKRVGALELLLELSALYPNVGETAPLMQTQSKQGWKVVSRAEVTMALRLIVNATGRDPKQYALHSGRIRGATQLAAEGASELQIQRAGR